MGNIIVDTSSILFGLSKKVDVFESVAMQLGYGPVISKGVIRELDTIAERGGSYAKHAKAAKALIERHGPVIEDDEGFVDDWIRAAAPRYGYVCTNDIKLKKSLRAEGISVYSISIGGKLK